MSTAIASLSSESGHRPPLTQPVSQRIPTLDGWRGIAILLVLLDHIQFGQLHRYVRPWMNTGQHGVTIFFVLSGFLITSKLLDGPIDLKRFYVRRFFRLMPAAWTYLAALFLLHLTSVADVRACVLFYRNFIDSIHPFTLHFWSLSMEEQFYLVWPAILLLAGARRCRWIAASGAVGCAVYRWAFWANYDRQLPSFQTQVRADAILIGCLLALVVAEPQVRLRAVKWAKYIVLPSLATLLFCIAHFHTLVPLYECAAIAGLIMASRLHPETSAARLLSLPLLAWLGKISYSLYLWHILFIWMSNSLLVYPLALLCSLCSYYCIERPFVRLGHSLTS